MKPSKCLIQTKSEDFGSVSSRRGGTGFPGSTEVGGSMKWHFLTQNDDFCSKFNMKDRDTDPNKAELNPQGLFALDSFYKGFFKLPYFHGIENTIYGAF